MCQELLASGVPCFFFRDLAAFTPCSHLQGAGNGGNLQGLGDSLQLLSLSSPCQAPRERQDLVQVELKGLSLFSPGDTGSQLPACPLGVLKEPSCAPGQLIILGS